MKKQVIGFLTLLCSAAIITGCSDESSSSSYTYTYSTPTPTVSPTTPESQKPAVSSVISVSNGTSQTIPEDNIIATGKNFGAVKGTVSLYNMVLGDTEASVVSWQDGSIEFKVPATAVTGEKYYVRVKNAKGDVSAQTAANALEVLAPAAPQLLALQPCAASGNNPEVTLTGRNFGNSGTISIKDSKNSTYSATVRSWTDSRIVIQLSGAVPANKALSVSVVNPTVGKTSQAMLFTKVSESEKPLITSAKLTVTSAAGDRLNGSANHTFSRKLQISGSNLSGVLPANIRLTASGGSSLSVALTADAPATDSAASFTTTGNIPPGLYTLSLTGGINAANEASVYQDQVYDSTYGIFVGISKYENPKNNLQNPEKDARDMNLALFPSGQENKKELLNDAATKANILQAIDDYIALINAGDSKKNSLFVFYYSGHGFNDGTKAYICPYETGASASMISDAELLAKIRLLPDATKKVIIFDSCHSGGFISKSPGNYRVKSLATEESAPVFRGEGFKQLAGVPNLVFMAAARGDQLSLDGGDMGNGMYTHFLLEGLGKNMNTLGAAAYKSPANSQLSAENLFWYSQPLTAEYSAKLGETYRFDPQMTGNYAPGNLPIKGALNPLK